MNAGLIDLCHWCSLAFILCSQFVKSTVQCHRKWRQGKGKKTVSVIRQREPRLWGLASCCSSLINCIVTRVFAAGDNWLQAGSLFPSFDLTTSLSVFCLSPDVSIDCMCVGSDCNEEQCTGDQCYTSVIIINDVTTFKRGCLIGSERKRMTCSANPSASRIVECCSQHMCNANVTKETLLRLLLTSKSIHSNSRETRFIICNL